jgi:hypothetical protein
VKCSLGPDRFAGSPDRLGDFEHSKAEGDSAADAVDSLDAPSTIP